MSIKRANTLFGECLAEFIGTGLLIFFGAGCVAALVVADASFGLWEISISWGLGVAIAIYVAGGVSGAHLNPAVTLALTLFRGFDKHKVLPFMAAQLAGAFTAAALVYSLYQPLFLEWEQAAGVLRGSQESLALAGIFTTYPHPLLSNGHAFMVELVITAVLMMAILALVDERNGGPKGMGAALLIGLLIAVIGAATGPLTGFAMNPARDFGPKLFAWLAGWGEMALTGGRDNPYFWVPLLGPVAGACLGAWLYDNAIARFLPAAQTQASTHTSQETQRA